MGRIVVTEFVSLDGVMEDPGGAEDFKHGGWSFAFSRGDDGDKFKLEEARGSEALLLGRVPTMASLTHGRSATMSSRTSSTACPSMWSAPRRTRLGGPTRPCSRATPIRAARRLREEHEGDIVVHGSAQLAQTLLEHDVVDELRLMVFPVVLGTGKRLFDGTSDKKTLRLVDSKVVGDGNRNPDL